MNRSILTATSIGAALWAAPIFSAEAHWSILRADPRLDELFPDEAVIELVTGGHDWVEGPAVGNVAFGDGILYIAATDAIYRVKMSR